MILLQVGRVPVYDFTPKGNFYLKEKKITIVNIQWNIMQPIK